MRLTTILFIAALLLVPCMAHADIPQFMSYQGVLRDASGDPVPDGTYRVKFKLYDVETGGGELWSEAHDLVATAGIIEAPIGSITPLSGLSFEVPYWLGISVEYEAELVPRTALATAPYAGRAGSAESCDNVDDHDWEVDGDNLYRGVGNVGIGTITPDSRLEVVTGSEPCARFEGGGSNYDFNIRSMNSAGTAGAFFSGTGSVSAPLTPAAVYGSGGSSSRGGQFNSDGSDALFVASPNGKGIWARSTGNYAGYFDGGGWGVYVEDQLETNEFRMQPGAAYGYVLTSSSGGEGTWQPAAAVPDGDWTIAGSDMYSTVSGEVGIGTTTPAGKLDISTDAGAAGLYVSHGASSVSRVIDVERTSTHNSGNDLVELSIPSGSSDTSQFIECDRGGNNVFAVNGNGYVSSDAGAEFGGAISVDDYADVVGLFTSSAPSNHAKILSGISTATSAAGVVGVYGESVPVEGFGVGCKGVGGYTGVRGEVSVTSDEPSYAYYGVSGYVTGGTGTNYGVKGFASGGSTNYGIYGDSAGGASDYAGYFTGSVHVTGTLTAGTKSFMIDHPLDPENKYLQHSSVESDEMMNIYNGNVVLDARGEAWVEMADWFEALNQDFRYQLTPMGAPGPNLYIAEEISGGRFMIAGGDPGAKVSWQVTGVRHDPVALANAMSVERDKPTHEAGKYLNPVAYGRPANMAVDYHEEKLAVSTPGEVLARVRRSERSSDDGD